MKKINIPLILFLFIISNLFSQNFDLSALTIPDSLKTKANAVIRYENTSIEIVSQSKMTIEKEMIVTVLNKLGKSKSNIHLWYDDHTKVNNVGAKIYNAFGIEIKKIKRGDFKDVSAVSSNDLYSDNRILYYEYIPISYPYTIKYHYTTTTSHTAFIPDWTPVNNYYTSTQKSNFTLEFPESISINFKEQNLKKLLHDIKKLKPHYQEVINLRYFQELSYKEIAKKLDEPMNNIKVKLLRAKKLLAELIANK